MTVQILPYEGFLFTELPTNPYPTFAAYMKHVQFNSRQHKYSKAFAEYPCYQCSGYGYVRNFEDRDPIEGYKHAPSYTCSDCRGSGLGAKSLHLKMYSNHMNAFRKSLAEAKNSRARETRIYAKIKGVLSPTELKVFYFIPVNPPNR